MALGDTQLFSPYPSVFGSMVIPDTIDTSVSTGIQQMAERAAGAIDVQMRALSMIDPTVTVNCLNLGHLGTVSPQNGLPISGTSKIQYQRRQHGGSSQFAGTNHFVLVSTLGALIPENVKASQDDQNAARLALKFWALWDGTTVDGDGNPRPLNVVSQALQGSPAIGAMYKLGPVVIDGTILGANKETTVTFGIGYQTKNGRGNGETVARVGAVYTRDPEFSFAPHNLDIVKDVSGMGIVQISGDVTVYYRNTSYGPAAAQHASFTLTDPTLEVGDLAANPGDDPKPGIIVRATGGQRVVTSLTATIPS